MPPNKPPSSRWDCLVSPRDILNLSDSFTHEIPICLPRINGTNIMAVKINQNKSILAFKPIDITTERIYLAWGTDNDIFIRPINVMKCRGGKALHVL